MLHTEVNDWQLWWWRREHFGHRYKFSSLLSDWTGDVVAECEDGAARLILTDTRVWKLRLNLQSESSDEWQRSSGFWLLTGSDQTLRSAAGLGRWCVRVCSHIRWNLYVQWNVLWMFQRIKYLPNILQVTFRVGEETEQNTFKSPFLLKWHTQLYRHREEWNKSSMKPFVDACHLRNCLQWCRSVWHRG